MRELLIKLTQPRSLSVKFVNCNVTIVWLHSAAWAPPPSSARLVSPALKRRPSRQAPPGPHPPGALKGVYCVFLPSIIFECIMLFLQKYNIKWKIHVKVQRHSRYPPYGPSSAAFIQSMQTTRWLATKVCFPVTKLSSRSPYPSSFKYYSIFINHK